MKVMFINGSPHEKGCCYTALAEMEKIFTEQGIDVEWVWVTNQAIHGCIGCGTCRTKGSCVFGEDGVNQAVEKFKACDAMVVASPVHYAAASGAITSFMDRFFYSCNKADVRLKPAAAVVSCRRGGAAAAFDQLNKYFTICEMPIVSSTYWNQIHGNTPDEAKQDLEGLKTMRVLARDMAYLIKAKALAKANGLDIPTPEAPVLTNFIR